MIPYPDRKWHLIHCIFKRSTNKTILIEFEGEEYWLPKSQLETEAHPLVPDLEIDLGVADWILYSRDMIKL